METTKEIAIDKIKVLENIRTNVSHIEIAELMNSIKQHGLLQPIGVWQEGDNYILRFGHRRLEACKKLGWKMMEAKVSDRKLTAEEFITQNTIENVHRKDISPVELGKICHRLKKLGLVQSEIAVRLSIPEKRVRNALEIYIRVPEKYKNIIGYIERGQKRKGKLSASVTNAILGTKWITTKNKEKLFEIAKREELSADDIRLLTVLLRKMDFEKAIKERKQFVNINVHLVFRKKELEKTREKHEVTRIDLIRNLLHGKIPLNKKLVL